MRVSHIVVISATLWALNPGPVLADPTDQARAERTEHAHDYSRFSDGPRHVPTPRGGSLARATALELGTREAASQLMHAAPEPRWTRAAGWRGREVNRLLWPVDGGGYVRGFGFVRRTRPDLRHDGVDISAPIGTVVRAAADGIVAYSDNTIRGFGNCVLIVHPNGWVSLYAHNSRTTVQPGWRVRRGERIALLGSTGISRGPHVHFELFERGRNIDPVAHFDGGPAFVRRVAQRAFRAGRVTEPQALDAEDRATPTPLTPASAPSATPEDDSIAGLGTRALMRRLHRFAPDAALLAHVTGRRFPNLLWPVRGGSVRSSSRRLLRAAAEDAPVRATADGVIVYADAHTLVLVQRNGWVSTYRRLSRVTVEVGASVERGAWIGRTDRGLDLELRVDGRRVDPLEHMVGTPAAN